MPGALEGPLGPLPNMFWDPVRAKYFPNPRQSTAVPNQPRQERPDTRPPSPTRPAKNSKNSSRECVERGKDPGSSKAEQGSGSGTANAPARRKLNAFRGLGGRMTGNLATNMDLTNRQDRMRGYVFLQPREITSPDGQSRVGVLEQPQAPRYRYYWGSRRSR